MVCVVIRTTEDERFPRFGKEKHDIADVTSSFRLSEPSKGADTSAELHVYV